jgi:hypothetical protein
MSNIDRQRYKNTKSDIFILLNGKDCQSTILKYPDIKNTMKNTLPYFVICSTFITFVANFKTLSNGR